MIRKIGVATLAGFLLYTGSYIFVYLWRAFRLDGPSADVVRIWHGDNFVRTLLVSVFFLIGLTIVGFLWLGRTLRAREGRIRVRRDLLDWLESEAGRTGDDADRVAERAIAAYRSRLEGDSRVPGPVSRQL